MCCRMDFLLVIGAKHTAKSPEGIFRKISDLNLYSDHVLQNGFSPGNLNNTINRLPRALKIFSRRYGNPSAEIFEDMESHLALVWDFREWIFPLASCRCF